MHLLPSEGTTKNIKFVYISFMFRPLLLQILAPRCQPRLQSFLVSIRQVRQIYYNFHNARVKCNFVFINYREQEIPTGEVIDIIYSPNATNSCNSCLRAAGAIFNKDGHLIVTGDTTNEIFRVAYDSVLPVISNVYHWIS